MYDSVGMTGISKLNKNQIKTTAWVTKDTLKMQSHMNFFYRFFHIFLIKIRNTMDISNVMKVSLVKNAKAAVVSKLTLFYI